MFLKGMCIVILHIGGNVMNGNHLWRKSLVLESAVSILYIFSTRNKELTVMSV
jgi:hypothetical protein